MYKVVTINMPGREWAPGDKNRCRAVF